MALQMNGVLLPDLIKSDEHIANLLESIKKMYFGPNAVYDAIRSWKDTAERMDKLYGLAEDAKSLRLLIQRVAREVGL